MKPCRLEPINSVLSAANCRLALTPVTEPSAAPAHDPARIQPEDLSASAATADELQKHSAGAHGNADDANLGRDWHAVVSLKCHLDTRHVGRQIV